MSEPEGFAARWSRLKRESAKEQQDGTPADTPTPPRSATPPEPSPLGREAGLPGTMDRSKVPFDIKSLPPIETITAGSDIKAFLQSGVPAELTRAALRRAWASDPTISGFIGLAENQWDFTDPTAIPGFGALEATQDMRRAVAQAMGRLCEPTKVPAPEDVASASQDTQAEGGTVYRGTPSRTRTDSIAQENACHQPGYGPEEGAFNTEVAAVQQTEWLEEAGERPSRRTHGGALPK